MGYHSTDPDRGARLCFHLKPGSYDTAGLIEALEQVKVYYRGERVVLAWDGLSAHWSRAMRAWVAEQDWPTLERLPAYAPELNPVEPLWSSLKKRELANPPAIISPMSPAPPSKASIASTPTPDCHGHSSPIPA
ncbi:transposase [Streptomyces somaliensis]|uniref:transposase n=1 Tax=Streptomyces somaliensis TaxID=78355 RepID=UPI0034E951F9|nr:transposase [Streptomyces somaliensis]MCP9974278.1 transposase [Streptomyces somaliensis]